MKEHFNFAFSGFWYHQIWYANLIYKTLKDLHTSRPWLLKNFLTNYSDLIKYVVDGLVIFNIKLYNRNTRRGVGWSAVAHRRRRYAHLSPRAPPASHLTRAQLGIGQQQQVVALWMELHSPRMHSAERERERRRAMRVWWPCRRFPVSPHISHVVTHELGTFTNIHTISVL